MDQTMLSEILQAITDWPVVAQAIFGSALFAAISWAGQRASAFVVREYSRRSKKKRIEFLIDTRVKYVLAVSKDQQERTLILTGLLYKCARSCVKAFIWFSLGFAGSMYIAFLGFIGILGALFYLFSALNTLKGVDLNADAHARIKELTEELGKLEKA